MFFLPVSFKMLKMNHFGLINAFLFDDIGKTPLPLSRVLPVRRFRSGVVRRFF